MREFNDAGADELKTLTEALSARRTAIKPESDGLELGKRLEQVIRFCTTIDRVRVAYASVGDGPPLIKAANWLNHLEYDWDRPIWRHIFRGLARDHRLIRYDARGNGLSDWDVKDISFNLMRVSTSPQNAVRLQEALSTVDIRLRLRMVRVPTLVLHSRNDGRVSYPRGLELARGIPNARLVTLESNNHLILEHEPEFSRFMAAIREFLRSETA